MSRAFWDGMQQHDGRPAAAMSDVQRDLADVDAIKCKAFEEHAARGTRTRSP
jgi:hypothetical protein